MSAVLKFSTIPSLFEPVEVEIDGKLLRVKRITLDSLEKIQALQERATAGSASAIRESLAALLEGDTSILGSLPIDKVAELITVVVEAAIKPGLQEKNSPGPGVKSIAS